MHDAVREVDEDTLNAQRAEAPPLDLTVYIMNLEALVRWLARTFVFEDQEGNRQVNDPVWPYDGADGELLPESKNLARTWHYVMHDAPVPVRDNPEVD